MNLERDAAEGIHRVEDAQTNWYLVCEGSHITVIDTGLPRSWNSLQSVLGALGRSPADIEAVVLTHAHFDHMGFARRAQRELGVPIWAHSLECANVSHPWRYDHERSRIPYLRHPGFRRIFAEMTAAGALWVRGTDTVRAYSSEDELPVPGHPRVVFTPGHTHGHCSLLFPDRGAVLVGDAFVMVDPYTGRRGPCIVAGAATADSIQALESLSTLEGLDASIAMTGHGPVWRGEMADAVARAREAGPA